MLKSGVQTKTAQPFGKRKAGPQSPASIKFPGKTAPAAQPALITPYSSPSPDPDMSDQPTIATPPAGQNEHGRKSWWAFLFKPPVPPVQ